jgi:lipoprotein NlpD
VTHSMLSFTPGFRFVPAISPALTQLVVSALLLAIAACTSRVPAPIEERSPRTVVAPPAAVAPAPQAVPEPDLPPPTYTVKRGDTLHAIALDHGLDYRELAALNNIENPNLIQVGQVLRLAAPGEGAPVGAAGVTTMPLRTVPTVVSGDARPPASPSAEPFTVPGPRNAENYKTQPKALKEPYSEQALREMQRMAAAAPPAVAPPTTVVSPPVVATPAPASSAPAIPAPAASAAPVLAAPATSVPGARTEPKSTANADENDEKLDWVWPAKGKLVTGFSDTANLKGIDIAGTAGAPVVASATGKVVYAGTGLRGYGKLVIVKHNGTYLTAYAHNRDIIVKEGQPVTRGQKIAEMGSTDADQVKLHFEIRRHGKPVDPIKYLPPA